VSERLRWHRHGHCPKSTDGKNLQDLLGSDCYKELGRSKPFSPGLLVIWCPHGICYGFQLLEAAENPVQVFKFFYQRLQTGMND
jgi:hypothetical protein